VAAPTPLHADRADGRTHTAADRRRANPNHRSSRMIRGHLDYTEDSTTLTDVTPAIEHWWADMRQPALTEELKAALISGVEVEAAGRTPSELAAERDRRLILLLQALRQSSAAERSGGGRLPP
jgi:hypothetical protein